MPDQSAVNVDAKNPSALGGGAQARKETTRDQIVAAALDLFRERGFEAATMREIAARAHVAIGAAYYYFASKDAIVLAFYDRAQKEMAPKLEDTFSSTRDLRLTLDRLITVKLEYFKTSRALLAALTAHADPDSPVSPFSVATREIRERDMDYFRRAIAISNSRIPKDLQRCLPQILWMYQMGVILFWIYDRSNEQRRTRSLIDKSLRLVAALIKASGLPLLKPLRHLVIDLVETVAS